jgi:hypothetical protein
LLKRGAIELVEQPDKKKYYQVAERLFNIYYLMRKRGDVDGRVKTAIDFLHIFYSDLSDIFKRLSEETESQNPSERIELVLAFSHVQDIAERSIEEKRGRIKELRKQVEELQREIDIREYTTILGESGKSPQEIVEHLIKCVSGNNASLMLAILIEGREGLKLEPLVVGLKIFLGEEHPLVPQEIFEVGKDIADRIRSKQAELVTLPQKGVEAADKN